MAGAASVQSVSPLSWLTQAEFSALAEDPDATERFSPLGDRAIVFVDVSDNGAIFRRPSGLGIAVGVDFDGKMPAGVDPSFDLLLTVAPIPRRPWVGVDRAAVEATAARLAGSVGQSPIAAATLARLLRVAKALPFEDALAQESTAYSTLLGGAEYRRWRSSVPLRDSQIELEPPIRMVRDGDVVSLSLNRPGRHNAFDARMRDELVEALRACALDRTLSGIVLRGEGPSFCGGGDLDEFGTAPDLATAHAVRIQRSAVLCVYRDDRVSVRLHGACIGAGIEIAAAARDVSARPEAWFRLPEIGMGLIPGAGGTVSIPRRIGRHRACYMALTGTNVDARTALDWGLIDRIRDWP